MFVLCVFSDLASGLVTMHVHVALWGWHIPNDHNLSIIWFSRKSSYTSHHCYIILHIIEK